MVIGPISENGVKSIRVMEKHGSGIRPEGAIQTVAEASVILR